MNGLEGDGYTVLGVTVDGPPPLGRIHLDVGSGLAVLYGLNGSGKTRFLQAVAAALEGYALQGGRGLVHVKIHDPDADSTEGFPGAVLSALRVDMLSEVSALGLDEDASLWSRRPGSLRELVEKALSGLDRRLDFTEALVSEAANGGYLTLEAVGASQPSWRIWISGPAEEGSPLAEAARAVAPFVRRSEEIMRQARSEGADSDVAMRMVDELTECMTKLEAMSPWELGDPALDNLFEDSLVGRPAWLPLEVACAGSTSFAPVDVIDVDESEADLDGRTARELLPTGFMAVQTPLFDDVASATLTQAGVDSVAELERSATRSLRSLVGAGPVLRFELRTPEQWFVGAQPRWVCEDEHGSQVPVEQLSRFRRRWAVASIQLALSGVGTAGVPAIVLSDEPEAGVHRTGEEQVVAGLSALTAGPRRAGIVATHSPAFLREPSARLLHVRRNLSGETEVLTLDGLPHDEELGLTKADFLALRRVFVVVEGEHDKIVLESVFGDELRRAFAQILVLRGASRAIAAAHAEWLLAASDAPLLIVLDKLSETSVREAWAMAAALVRDGRSDDALDTIRTLKGIAKDEAGFLSRLGEAAIRTGTFHRLHFFGLGADDILLYLPDGPRLVEEKRTQILESGTVRAAISSLDELPSDLTNLVEEITRLATFFGRS